MVLIKNPKHISNFDSLWDYPALEFRARAEKENGMPFVIAVGREVN